MINDLSDWELDVFYSQNTGQARVTAEVEILKRLSDVQSFLGGLIGLTRFPQYDARGNFRQVEAARDSVSERSKKIGNDISNFGVGIYWKVVLLILLVFGVYFLAMKK